jgi:hypothetical protein
VIAEQFAFRRAGGKDDNRAAFLEGLGKKHPREQVGSDGRVHVGVVVSTGTGGRMGEEANLMVIAATGLAWSAEEPEFDPALNRLGGR